MRPPLLLGVVAKEPVYAPELLERAPSTTCARCDRRMVVTKDAIGRERYRCPHCDGVAQSRHHPDEVMLPQGLVRASPALPPISPGQLRCQRCAKGVEGDHRFCPGCRPGRGRDHVPRSYQPKPCARCSAVFQPSGPRALFCEACR